MPTAEHCLAMADEADRLAAIVSYGRDKARLKQQAQDYRVQAQALSQTSPAAQHGEMAHGEGSSGVIAWLRRRRA